jgi:hypothetical protein
MERVSGKTDTLTSSTLSTLGMIALEVANLHSLLVSILAMKRNHAAFFASVRNTFDLIKNPATLCQHFLQFIVRSLATPSALGTESFSS